MRRPATVLLVDDDPSVSRVVMMLLEEAGYRPTAAESVAQARAALSEHDFDIVVTDLKLPDGDGLEVLRDVRATRPETPVLVITAFATVPTAVEAMKLGAFDYLTKPFANDRLLALLANALKLRDLSRENLRLRRAVADFWGPGAIIGSSPAMAAVRESVRLAAATDAAVMVLGETGTGKELVARAIHGLGSRAQGPFVAVNCGALPENLVESELFGHRRGAFTGAVADRSGRFVEADTGTLFLDEITEMKPDAQVKLLRVLESREVQPVGATRPVRVDVRIISAANRSPQECVAGGGFREDLYYRLNVFAIAIPPLRERTGDIPELVHAWLAGHGLGPEAVSREALALLAEHDFPGNVRELQNVIESALIMSQGRSVRPEHVAARLLPPPTGRPTLPEAGLSLDDVERHYLVEALRKTGGNRTHAARLLGISRATLLYRIKKHGVA
ncbi:MAG: sigma-54 dependent transcriptional regulator [bacterium]